jgi:hypothetical protein
MNSNHDEIKFVKVSSEDVCNFLGRAIQKIIIAKPGYTIAEVDLLLGLHNNRGIDCTVYVDPAEDAVRWGFGEDEALQKLCKNIENLNVKTAERIRLSIVVVDNVALAFAPIALSWEEEPEDLAYPNGLLCTAQIAQSFIDQLETPTELSDEERKVIDIFSRCPVPQKTEQEATEELKDTIEKLEKNPAVDPAKLRKITVYRNNYKLLKVEMRGVNLKSKTVDLNPINSLFPNVNRRLKASWRAFSKEDSEKIWQFNRFGNEIGEIIKAYTLDVGRFGYLIKVEDLKRFRKDIAAEKGDLLLVLEAKKEKEIQKANPKYIYQDDKQAKLFSQEGDNTAGNVKTLKSLLDESLDALKKYFKDFILSNPEAKKTLFEQNRTVMKMVERGDIKEDQAIEDILEELISSRLRFPNPGKLLGSINALVDVYDVSDELLYKNEEFKQCLQKLKTSRNKEDHIKIRKFSDAFETSI